MPFHYGPLPSSSSTRVRGPVFAVGRRVSVAAEGTFPARVTLMDESGATALANLADGAEVEILAWRPGGSRGVRYRVRATENGAEGWVAVGSLRGAASDAAAPVVEAAEVPSARRPELLDTGRRFGQR